MTDQSDYCNACTACCYRVPGPPFGKDEPPPNDPALATEVKLWQEVPQEISVDAPCPWLDLKTGRCLHYDDRPGVCRDDRFPIGEAGCQLARAKRGLDPDPDVHRDRDDGPRAKP